MKPTLSVLAFVLCLGVATSAFAADTLFCKYGTWSDPTGNHKVKDKFDLTFIIDNEKGVAYMIGNQGSEEVTFLPSSVGSFTFIEITGVGNVMTTTVDSKGASVHSRNTTITGELFPSQYYGTCQFK